MTAPQQSLPNVPLVAQPVFPVDQSGNPLVPAQESGNLASIATNTKGATNSFTQPANTAGVVVGKGSPGRLWSAVVTATGTAGLDVYDNATTNSGTKLLSIPANAPVGSIYNIWNGGPASNGIASNGVANCPAVTFYIS